MSQRETRSSASAPVPRLLLLLLAFGLLQMHSFGHLDHDRGGAGHPVAAGHMEVPGPAQPPPAPAAPESDPTLGLLAVCLAVLTSVGLIGALVGLLTVRAGYHGRSGGRSRLARRYVGRDPPAAVPRTGDRLARLSVLRI